MKVARLPLASLFAYVMIFSSACSYVGSTTGTNYATVTGGVATITVSPSLNMEIPVNLALGDEVAKAAANAAVGYLTRIPVGGITPDNRKEAVEEGVNAGLKKADETGRQITDANKQQMKSFVEQVVQKI